MTASCDDLKLGGTLSATGITGGTSINSTALYITDWTSILGTPGISGSVTQIAGLPGGRPGGDGLPSPRFFTLNIGMTRWNSTTPGGLTEPTPEEELWENTDDFLTLLAAATLDHPAPLEILLPDGTARFLEVANIDPAPIAPAGTRRQISVPLVAQWPYWRASGNESTDTITTSDTLVIGGRVNVYNPVLVFSGDGTFEGPDWEIEVVDSGGPVTVDLGARTVTEGGLAATNRIRRTKRYWGYFTAGNNTVDSDVSVEVKWRNQWV